MNPITIFQSWLQQHVESTSEKIPTACCLSTIGLDGFPNARFVSLKEIVAQSFIVTGPLTSRKGLEINANNKVALTFWWAETGRQVRIQGVASRISEELADKYFYERNRDSQIVSIVSDQGQEMNDPGLLLKDYHQLDEAAPSVVLARPESWGGYSIRPIRIEFLTFQATRFHDRQLYEQENNVWKRKQLQP